MASRARCSWCPVPDSRHHSRRAQAISSGPLSQRRCAGAPRSATSRSSTSTRSSAVTGADPHRERLAGVLVHDVGQLQPPAISGLVELEVDRPHVVGLLARSRSAVPVATRRRLRGRTGRRRPSSRHSRWTRLRFTPLQAAGLAAQHPPGHPPAPPGMLPGRAHAAARAARLVGLVGPIASGVGWRGAGRRPGTPGAGRPRSGPAGARRPCGGAPGSEVSLGQLLEQVDLQRLVGHQPLEPGVLGLQLLQPLGRRPSSRRTGPASGDRSPRRSPTPGSTSARSAPSPSSRRPRGPCGCLLRGVPASLHRDRPPAHSLGDRTLTVDGPISGAHVTVNDAVNVALLHLSITRPASSTRSTWTPSTMPRIDRFEHF